MFPNSIFVKIGLTGVFLAVLTLGAYQSGKNAVQDAWDRDRAIQIEQANEIILSNQAHNREVRDAQEAYTRKIEEEHAKALHDLQGKYDAAVADLKHSGGLRLPRSVCTDSVGAGTKAEGPFRVDDPATIRLPATVEVRLLAIAQTADESTLQCSKLQEWVKENGFYH